MLLVKGMVFSGCGFKCTNFMVFVKDGTFKILQKVKGIFLHGLQTVSSFILYHKFCRNFRFRTARACYTIFNFIEVCPVSAEKFDAIKRKKSIFVFTCLLYKFIFQGPATTLPLLAWQIVIIQVTDSSRVIDPVLAFGRHDTIYFYQVSLIVQCLIITGIILRGRGVGEVAWCVSHMTFIIVFCMNTDGEYKLCI